MNRMLAFFLLLLCCSCGETKTQVNEPADADISRTSPRWAKGFDFYENESERGLILFDLVNDGAVLSRWARLKEGASQNPYVHYLKDDLKLAAQSTTQMAMVEAVDGLDHLSCVAYLDYVKSKEILKRADEGRMQDISGVAEIDFEKLVQCDPDLILIYPFGYESEEKFTRAGIASIPISEYLESHPLGRSEWVKAIGWLLNEEENAKLVFDQVERDYLAIAKENNDNGPVVFTGSYSGGNWYAPGGKTFMARFIEDAGGVYLFADENVNENITLPFETLYTRALKADFWGKVIYEKGQLTMNEIKSQDERFAELPCFQNEHVFYCNASETDYFGEGVMQPHLILSDLIHLLNEDTYQPNFFKPVKK